MTSMRLSSSNNTSAGRIHEQHCYRFVSVPEDEKPFFPACADFSLMSNLFCFRPFPGLRGSGLKKNPSMRSVKCRANTVRNTENTDRKSFTMKLLEITHIRQHGVWHTLTRLERWRRRSFELLNHERMTFNVRPGKIWSKRQKLDEWINVLKPSFFSVLDSWGI